MENTPSLSAALPTAACRALDALCCRYSLVIIISEPVSHIFALYFMGERGRCDGTLRKVTLRRILEETEERPSAASIDPRGVRSCPEATGRLNIATITCKPVKLLQS